MYTQCIDVPLVEPVVIQDIFVTDLHNVEHVGDGVYRFTFFVSQQGDRVCAARLVLESAAILRAATWALRAIGFGCCGKLVKRCLH